MTCGSRAAPVWLYATAAAAYLADRVTKVLVERTLGGEPPFEIVRGVLAFNYTTNSGGAFGIGRSAPWLFAGATIVVSSVIVFLSFRLHRLPVAVALGLVLGGAMGNLTDRAMNGPGLSGHVVDFIDLMVWPVFNLADTAIVVGALLLALATAGHEERDESARPGGLGERPGEP
ncbi:MAG TPA: signal peptidase II [Actinomycetota bacterium]|nr:signal peptidase II [Actinomycetota bacterium]